MTFFKDESQVKINARFRRSGAYDARRQKTGCHLGVEISCGGGELTVWQLPGRNSNVNAMCSEFYQYGSIRTCIIQRMGFARLPLEV